MRPAPVVLLRSNGGTAFLLRRNGGSSADFVRRMDNDIESTEETLDTAWRRCGLTFEISVLDMVRRTDSIDFV